MKVVNRILLIFFILFNTKYCISFTESNYTEASFDQFKASKLNDQVLCKNDFLEYRLFLYLQKFNELECKFRVNDQDYKFHWIKTDHQSSSFIAPLDEIGNSRLFPISFLAWMGIIPNYQERKINIAVKVFSEKGLLWEKDYYNYYEVWSSILFLPVMPIKAIFNKESIPDQVLLEILENMVRDFKLRGILEK